MIKKLALLTIPFVIVSCASHTGIVKIGQETYMIAKQQGTGFPGLGNMKAEIISEGVKYCDSKGLEFQIISTNETAPPYILGNYPRSEIQFMCLRKGDPQLGRPRLEKTPDVMIQHKK
jgi:hypothetical protein